MATEEIQRAQHLESTGRRKKAVKHYIAALECYERQCVNPATDEFARLAILMQCNELITPHIAKLRIDIEKRPRSDDTSDSGEEDDRRGTTSDGGRTNNVNNVNNASSISMRNNNATTASSTTGSSNDRYTPPPQQKGGGGGSSVPTLKQFPSIPQQRPSPPYMGQSSNHPPQPQMTTMIDEATITKDQVRSLCLRPEEMSDVSWNDVIGMETVKRAMRMAVEVPHQLSHMYQGNRVAATALLMYGPPGVGKTFIVKALAKQSGHTFLPVSCASIISKYVGDSPKYVKAMLEVAKENKPCILFIDEFDALCPSRDSSSNSSGDARTVSEFLQQLDGITKDDMKGVFMIGATNLPWDIDEAARRRFARMIYIPLPTEEDRYRLIAHRLCQNSDDVGHGVITDQDMRQLACDTVHYSSADLVKLIVTAYEGTVEDVTRATHFRVAWEKGSGLKVLVPCQPSDKDAKALPYDSIKDDDKKHLRPCAVTYEYLRATMERIKPSVNLDRLAQYDGFTDSYGEKS